MKMKTIGSIAATSLAVAAGVALTTSTAGAATGRASGSAIKDYAISVLSDCSDCGAYVWDEQLAKDPTDPTYSDITVLSGGARFKWTWPGGGTQASHNVKMKVGVNFFTKIPFSTPGLDFFGGKGSGAPFTNDSGVDWTWPTKENGGVDGWVPTKAGTYYLFCSQHSGMYMRVIVKPLVASAATKRSLRKGTRGVAATLTSAAEARTSLKLVLCRNRKCTKTKTIASKAFNVRKGGNTVKLPTGRLAKGRYRLLVTTTGNVLTSSFSVK